MHAELFPVIKIPLNYGDQSYQLRGKAYEELLPKIPFYTQKVMETRKEVSNSIPTDKEEALAKYLEFRKMLFARDKEEKFIEPTVGFEDRMRLRRYSEVIGDRVKITYPNIPKVDNPLDWLDDAYLLYRYMDLCIYLNYVQPSRLRPKKIISKSDHCTILALSLKTDKGWDNGIAKNAYDLVFRCYDIFPYNDIAAKNIFDMGILMTEFYVFRNYSSNGVGANVAFKTLKEQQLHFDSSLHFHDFFGRVINRLYDAHISYKADCFEQFTFVQPVYIQHLFDENHKFGVYITKVNSLELQGWVGARVMAIDGLYANYRMLFFGDQIGKSQYWYTRFILGNSRLLFESSSQDFILDRGLYLKRTTIPERSYLTYTLRKPGMTQDIEIKLNWRVYKNPTVAQFNDQYTYWDKNCEAKPLKRIFKDSKSSTLQRRSSGALQLHNKFINTKRRSLVKKRSGSTGYKPTIDGTIPIAIGPGFAFFILNDVVHGDYGLLLIRTFDVADTESWFKNMRLGFTTLMDKGITRLLLDLTGNSGGTLCLAYSLLGVFSPSPTYPFPATKFDYGTRAVPTSSLMRIATCADEAQIEVSPFKLKCFTNLATRTDFPDGYNWATNSEVKPKVLNGLMYGYSRFSSFLMDKCELKSTPILADVKPNFATIILLSDGLCGSSCAIVAAYLQQHGSPAILVSPKDDDIEPITLFSFAGGQVVNFKNVKDVARRSSCFDMLPDILENTQMTITYRAIFHMEDQRNPLEYYKLPAQHVFDYILSYAGSYTARWKDVFNKGMEIFQHPNDYIIDTSETGVATPYFV